MYLQGSLRGTVYSDSIIGLLVYRTFTNSRDTGMQSHPGYKFLCRGLDYLSRSFAEGLYAASSWCQAHWREA